MLAWWHWKHLRWRISLPAASADAVCAAWLVARASTRVVKDTKENARTKASAAMRIIPRDYNKMRNSDQYRLIYSVLREQPQGANP